MGAPTVRALRAAARRARRRNPRDRTRRTRRIRRRRKQTSPRLGRQVPLLFRECPVYAPWNCQVKKDERVKKGNKAFCVLCYEPCNSGIYYYPNFAASGCHADQDPPRQGRGLQEAGRRFQPFVLCSGGLGFDVACTVVVNYASSGARSMQLRFWKTWMARLCI